MKIPAIIPQLFLPATFAGVLIAQQLPPSGPAFQGQRIIVTEAERTPDGVEPVGPAKICLAPSGLCFTAPDNSPPFGFSPNSTVVQPAADQQALLFTAIASAGGSGGRTLLALLVIRNGHLEDLLPGVTMSEMSEYKIWQEPSISKTALFVTADFVWGAQETHFSAHRFMIRAYDLEPSLAGSDRYDLRDAYVTSQKYPSEDGSVLEHEKPEVLARLRRQK